MMQVSAWAAAVAVLLCAAGEACARGAEPRLELLVYPPPPATVACADGSARVTRADPFPTIWLAASDALPVINGRTVRPAPLRIEVTFDITAEGRPHALREAIPGLPFAKGGTDMGAVVVGTWRFTPGRSFRGCRLGAAARFVHVEDATRSMLLGVVGEKLGVSNYDAMRAGPPAMTTTATEAFETDIAAFHHILSAPDSTCASAGPLHPVLKAPPDTSSLDDPPGARAWAMVDYDIAADGRTANAKLAGSSGDAAYDARALAAVQRSMFTGGARTGCLAVFRLRGPPLAWPREPPLTQPSSCPVEPALAAGDIGRFFPAAYQERKIEG